MKRSSTATVRVLGMTIPFFLLLVGCGRSEGDGREKATASPAPPEPPAASSPAPQGTPSGQGGAIGGADNGVRLRLPAGWKQVDPLKDSAPVVRTSFGLDGETGPLIRSLMERQVQQGTLFAIDTSVSSGLAPHLQAGCDRGGAVGASLDQLKRKQQALKPGSRITDLTVGGKPGFKATYMSQKRSGHVSGLTVRVPIATDRFCFVDIEAKQGALPAQAEQIAASFEPA
ncbi:hypothetical protein [Actinomadura sp. 9N407]|uniref:hypothetical protein n=1 Tax=Actinomadura sp. 9N407 TaxID=3375154 RepID=UPI00378DC315